MKIKEKASAYRRDVMEGRSSKRAIRIRIKMIANERGLSDAEVSRAMNCGTSAVVEFADKYNLSLDWLLLGDLKGLLRTVRWMQSSA